MALAFLDSGGSPNHVTFTNNSSTSLSINASAKFLIFVRTSEQSSGSDDLLTLTWNSVSMTRATWASDGFTQCGIWYLNLPATGSQTLAWDFEGTGGVTVQFFGFTLDGEAELEDFDQETGNSAGPLAMALTASAGSARVSGAALRNNHTASQVGTDDTEDWDQSRSGDSTFGDHAEYASGGAKTIDTDWTTSRPFAAAAAVFSELTGGVNHRHSMARGIARGMARGSR